MFVILVVAVIVGVANVVNASISTMLSNAVSIYCVLLLRIVCHGSWQAFRLPELELAFTERSELERKK